VQDQVRLTGPVTAPRTKIFRDEAGGRRSRRTPTDGTRFIFQPVPWHVVFGDDRPVEVEIGCGRGEFLVAVAASNPDRNFFGLESAARLAASAQHAIDKAGLTNARVLHCDARCVVRHLIQPHAVAAYHVYFPDPWWKRRHHKRRIYAGSFAADLARTLAPDGRVHVATDIPELLAALGRRFIEAGLHPTVTSRNALPTRFARRCAEVGRPVFQGAFAHP